MKCPFCGVELEVDEEYMQDTYGASYVYMPENLWTYYCPECEEAGTMAELEYWHKLQMEHHHGLS
jgi:hypothetical protein